ncbi:MAG: glycoside hydrolase family 88 protein [Breznakibacter sp.]
MKKSLSLLAFFGFVFQAMPQALPSKPLIISTMRQVNDYWISQNPSPGNNQWARAAYFTGHTDFYKVYPKATYLDYANLWATNNNWALNGGTSTRNADNQTCGQVYIDLYGMDDVKVPSKIDAIKASIDNMVVSTKIDDWWWIDALYMAMPVFTRLGQLTENDVYPTKMYQLYNHTKVTRGLYNASEGLWYRDESFKPPYLTPNGEDSYWSRGNGWVFAAHARALQLLPLADPNRTEYIENIPKDG